MVAQWACGGDVEKALLLPLERYNRYLAWAKVDAEAEPIQHEQAMLRAEQAREHADAAGKR